MRHRTVRLMLAAAALLAQPATHAGAPAKAAPGLPGMDTGSISISPVFHQLVAFTLPAHFRAAFEKTSGSFYIREHIPDTESVEKWTHMISLTGVKDLASNPGATPQAMTDRMMTGFRHNCPDTFSSAVLGPQTIDGFDTFQAIASCGHVQSGAQAYSEAAIMLAVKGSGDYYTLQWAERGPDSRQPLAIDTAYWTKQLAKLSPIRLCPIVPGEAPPYPSCLRSPQ
jgi:hypothetical protein